MSQRAIFSMVIGTGIAVLALVAAIRLGDKPHAPQASPSATHFISVVSAVPIATAAPERILDISPTPSTGSSPSPQASLRPSASPSATPKPAPSSPVVPTPMPSLTLTSSSSPSPLVVSTPLPTPKPRTYTVLMEPGRFNPATVTIRAGDTVRWVNQDANSRWPASDPHPAHTNLPGFDAKVPLEPGEIYAYTFMQAGTFSYHDHGNAAITGDVIVAD